MPAVQQCGSGSPALVLDENAGAGEDSISTACNTPQPAKALSNCSRTNSDYRQRTHECIPALRLLKSICHNSLGRARSKRSTAAGAGQQDAADDAAPRCEGWCCASSSRPRPATGYAACAPPSPDKPTSSVCLRWIKGWFFAAKREDQKFSKRGACRQNHYDSVPELREHKKLYIQKYRDEEKKREERRNMRIGFRGPVKRRARAETKRSAKKSCAEKAHALEFHRELRIRVSC